MDDQQARWVLGATCEDEWDGPTHSDLQSQLSAHEAQKPILVPKRLGVALCQGCTQPTVAAGAHNCFASSGLDSNPHPYHLIGVHRPVTPSLWTSSGSTLCLCSGVRKRNGSADAALRHCSLYNGRPNLHRQRCRCRTCPDCHHLARQPDPRHVEEPSFPLRPSSFGHALASAGRPIPRPLYNAELDAHVGLAQAVLPCHHPRRLLLFSQCHR